MVVTTLLFAIVTGIVRYIGSDIPAPVAAFIRYIISTLLFFPLIIKILFTLIGKFFLREKGTKVPLLFL